MKLEDLMVFLVVAGVLTMIPVLEDPYHEEGKVSLATWAYRELEEIVSGVER